MARMKQRRDTTTNWTNLNPILYAGELGWETDGIQGLKIGDGTTAWNTLDYIAMPGGYGGEGGDVSAHLADTADAHDASAISVLDVATIYTATNVETALAEVRVALNTDITGLSNHLADTSDAHDASAISVLDVATIYTATDVEAALAEVRVALNTDITGLSNHLADTSDAHDASAISVLDTAGNITATDAEAAFAEIAARLAAQTLNAQTGTTYTPVIGDNQKLVTLSNASAITLTLPQDSSVAIPIGSWIDFAQIGAGQVTFVAGSGATVNTTPGLKLRTQYSSCRAYKRSANTWLLLGDLTDGLGADEVIIIALGDESTAITNTGNPKVAFRMPFAMTLSAVRASLTVVSSSGTPTFDINEGGTTILSTKLTVDASEKTSTTAATAAVISDTALADDAEITIDVDTAGTNAAGAKIYLIGRRT